MQTEGRKGEDRAEGREKRGRGGWGRGNSKATEGKKKLKMKGGVRWGSGQRGGSKEEKENRVKITDSILFFHFSCLYIQKVFTFFCSVSSFDLNIIIFL